MTDRILDLNTELTQLLRSHLERATDLTKASVELTLDHQQKLTKIVVDALTPADEQG